MNAGTPPPPGTSRLTIHIYRLTPDGKRVAQSRRHTITATPDPERLADSLAWPPCRCPRCPRCRTDNAR
ncbi:hypothetical protein GCM10011579_086640 [Streptomyces albiflavescens]|uniref:Uncharacterized protein n=1 Tax=Streptomyces albiflavescens TaxID=1623582 RepID=A0A917YFG8_9ACTN|nr:hypothetical protein GCM10011579_086640 [Streptomyces albiflavescens]